MSSLVAVKLVNVKKFFKSSREISMVTCQRVLQLQRWGSIMISQHLPLFDVHVSSASGDMYLICDLPSQDHPIEGSSNLQVKVFQIPLTRRENSPHQWTGMVNFAGDRICYWMVGI